MTMQHQHGTDRIGEVRREIRESSPLPYDPVDEVSSLIERVCRKYDSTKGLAFSGHVPWSYQHLRRMANDGRIPGLDKILLFVRLAGPDDPFRERLIGELREMFRPDLHDVTQRVLMAVLPHIPERYKPEVHRIVVEAILPGGAAGISADPEAVRRAQGQRFGGGES